MVIRFSRQALYDLIWAEPMGALSVRFGVSEVALKNKCEMAKIPIPDRGYWAKRESGKIAVRTGLSARPPGMNDEITVSGGERAPWWESGKDDLLDSFPPSPDFPESIQSVRDRIALAVGDVSVPKNVRAWHPAVDRILKEAEKRQEELRSARFLEFWTAPRFETPFELRRLRILHAILTATTRMNGIASISSHGSFIQLSFYGTSVEFTLNQSRHRDEPYLPIAPDTARFRLAIRPRFHPKGRRANWMDSDKTPLESQLTQIAIELILTAEILYRSDVTWRYQRAVETKAKVEKEAQQRKLAAERADKERLEQAKQLQVDRLFRDATAFRQAREIRQYVEAVRGTGSLATCSAEIERWCQWALEQANRIDPIISGDFLKAVESA